jgi:dephospho-CoA kinase
MQKRNPCKNKIVLGVTGIFGSGKTTVTRIFKSLGADIIDADSLARGCTRRDKPAYKKIISVFGNKILNNNKVIDRKKLSRIVFHNKNLLLRLNNILHPEIIRIIKKRIKLSKSKVIVLDAPLLLEAGLGKIVDKLIVVKITQDKQLQRIKKRDSLSSKDILNRMRFQIPQSQKIVFADFVIDNSSLIKQTKKQVKKIWEHLPLDKWRTHSRRSNEDETYGAKRT